MSPIWYNSIKLYSASGFPFLKKVIHFTNNHLIITCRMYRITLFVKSLCKGCSENVPNFTANDLNFLLIMAILSKAKRQWNWPKQKRPFFESPLCWKITINFKVKEENYRMKLYQQKFVRKVMASHYTCKPHFSRKKKVFTFIYSSRSTTKVDIVFGGIRIVEGLKGVCGEGIYVGVGGQN